MKQTHLKTLQSEEELSAKRAEYIPDISAEFNSLTLLNFNSFLPDGSYSVGLSLSWEPFDWGRKKNEIAEKRAAVTQDKNTQTSTERKVMMEVDSKYRQLQQSWAKLHTATLSQHAATENLRVEKNQYEGAGRAAAGRVSGAIDAGPSQFRTISTLCRLLDRASGIRARVGRRSMKRFSGLFLSVPLFVQPRGRLDNNSHARASRHRPDIQANGGERYSASVLPFVKSISLSK